MRHHRVWALGLILAGCGAADETLVIGEDTTTDEIVRPTGEATAYPFVCTIRMGSGGACSGSLVARNVVLTASHCIGGASNFTVVCPYSGDAAPATGRQAVMSPTGNRSFSSRLIYPNSGNDVALIRLDREIRATRVGTVRLQNVGTGQRAYVIGRINNGSFTNRLWVSPVINLVWRYGPGSPPYALGAASGLTQPGDSGGATFDANTNEIIGVVSGGSPSSSIYAIVGAHAQWFIDTVTRWSGAPPSGMPTMPAPPPSMTPPPMTPPPMTPPPAEGEGPRVTGLTPTHGASMQGNRWVHVEAAITPGSSGSPISGASLWWSFNGERFACPGRSNSHFCNVEDGVWRWSINVGTGDRTFVLRAWDADGRTTESPAHGMSFSDGPANCSESSSGSSSIWTCTPDRQSRDRCLSNRLERQRCARGCQVYPSGVDDRCAP